MIYQNNYDVFTATLVHTWIEKFFMLTTSHFADILLKIHFLFLLSFGRGKFNKETFTNFPCSFSSQFLFSTQTKQNNIIFQSY